MSFEEVLDQAIEMLRRRKRVTYRALKRQFDLDDDFLEDLKIELIKGQHLAADEDGEVLVWTGADEVPAEKPAALATAAGKAQPVESAPPPTEPTTAPPSPPRVSAKSSGAELRQLTVMFCDIVDSTTLSGRLDPEDFSEVLQSYQASCAAVIERYEGNIAQYLGDGLLVYFGYPLAHEDDAQRAVRAGIDILQAMEGPNASLAADKGTHLSVRIGIHTGGVVVGKMGGGRHHEQLAVGEVPNIASRIQGVAEPDTIVISGATYRLAQSAFSFEDLGKHDLKGVQDPAQIYRVLEIQKSDSLERLSAGRDTGRTALVGRDSELTLLMERWAQAKESPGQVVMISGEAGIGKSRLVDALRESVTADNASRLVFECSPYYMNSALYPVIDHLRRTLQFSRDDSADTKAEKLEQLLKPHGFNLQEAVPLFATLLTVQMPERYPPLDLPAKKQSQMTQELLVSWLVEQAERRAVLMLFEDLQWADPSTLDLLGLLIDEVPTSRLLTVFTYRPEFDPPWTLRSYVTQLIVNRFTSVQVEEMVGEIAGKPFPQEVMEQVVEKTDGVPLFVEEVTKVLLESGCLEEKKDSFELTAPLSPLAVPATLHDSLTARLDRLSQSRMIAQVGAAIGREFSYELILAVSDVAEEALQLDVGRLVDSELVFRKGRGPHARYVFKHALVQDVAYQSLLRTKRQQYHRKIALALEDRFPETIDQHPELLAYHYTSAGVNERAILYWHKAAERAIAQSTHREAISHLTKGLELMESLEESTDRHRLELKFQISLGVSLQATKGYGSEEVLTTYERARRLCQRLGESEQLFPVLYGLFRSKLLRAQYAGARELGEELLLLAEGLQNPGFLAAAHRALGSTLFYVGESTKAVTHLREVLNSDIAPEDRPHAFLYDVVDPWVTAHSYSAWALWLLGYPDQARSESRQAVSTAESIGHPFSSALALSFSTWLHQFCRDTDRTRQLAEVAVALSTEHGFPFWIGWGKVLQGWTLAEEGRDDEAIATMRQGLLDWKKQGSELGWSYFLVLLSEVYSNTGKTSEGLEALKEAEEFVDRTGERWWESERCRMQGELLKNGGSSEQEVEQWFQRALDVARQQQAKSLELRAAMSLCKLWSANAKGTEARKFLGDVYAWFTEGFDTHDLRAAKALLEELG